MFVSIDMDKLVFLHKHHDHETLSALSFLEAPDRSITVENTDRPHFLSKMGRLELCILYKNATGADLVAQDNQTLRQQLADMVDHMPATLALRDEVEAQVRAVEDQLYAGTPFRYALGAKVPAAPQELFPLTAKPLSDNQLAASAALAPSRMANPAAPVTRAAETAPQPAHKAPRAHSGSVRPQIWAHADKVWEEAGKPTDRSIVLELRKTMMAELEEQGIKKTSSSNELGNWMKTRLA